MRQLILVCSVTLQWGQSWRKLWLCGGPYRFKVQWLIGPFVLNTENQAVDFSPDCSSHYGPSHCCWINWQKPKSSTLSAWAHGIIWFSALISLNSWTLDLHLSHHLAILILADPLGSSYMASVSSWHSWSCSVPQDWARRCATWGAVCPDLVLNPKFTTSCSVTLGFSFLIFNCISYRKMSVIHLKSSKDLNIIDSRQLSSCASFWNPIKIIVKWFLKKT